MSHYFENGRYKKRKRRERRSEAKDVKSSYELDKGNGAIVIDNEDGTNPEATIIETVDGRQYAANSKGVWQKQLSSGSSVSSEATPPDNAVDGDMWMDSKANHLWIRSSNRWISTANRTPTFTSGIGSLAGYTNQDFVYDLGPDIADELTIDSQLVYTLYSGALPGGISLPAAGSSKITGRTPTVANDTNYNFTIKATDVDGGAAFREYNFLLQYQTFKGTGGTKSTYTGYTVHTFTSGNSISFNMSGTVDILLVGGGGSTGSGGHSYGGDGGQVNYYSNVAVSAQSYTIGVGGGGSNGGNGSNSTGLSKTAAGGSGNSVNVHSDVRGGHGDGGKNRASGHASNGAVGECSSIQTGASKCYGGGGAGAYGGSGTHGGGNRNSHGTANTGGGAGAEISHGQAYSGGSGIVIIRYKTA